MTRGHATLARALCAAGLLVLATAADAQSKIKVGFMLPYTGTYAALGTAIENGFRLYVQEQGGKLGGRELEYFKVDDESEPSKAVDNINKLIKRDNVDVVVGTVHSGVVMAMAKVAKDTNTLLVIPNAGARAVTGPMCAPNIFRSSFSNWQPGYAMGKVAGERGAKKVVTITWKYAAGDESVQGFKDGIKASGGEVVKELTLPFPNVEFQALLTEIAATKPDAVYAFFAGGGAVKFVKDYAAAGLNKTIPLCGRPRHSQGQGVSYRIQQGVQERARRVRSTGLRCGATARRRTQRGEGRCGEARCARGGNGKGAYRQSARRVHAVQGARPGAGHLLAQGRRHAEQVRRRCGQGPGGAVAGLQDVVDSGRIFEGPGAGTASDEAFPRDSRRLAGKRRWRAGHARADVLMHWAERRR
jgi:ABC-type sugar transport system substrate-binding protein